MPRPAPLAAATRLPTPGRYGLLVFGLVLYGLALRLMLDARVGVAPWEAFHLGVTDHLPLTLGTVSILTGVLIVTFTALYLRERLYRHWQVERQVYQAEQVLTELFTAFLTRPALLPPRPRSRVERDGLPRAICDHLAGMTDRFALQTHRQLRG